MYFSACQNHFEAGNFAMPFFLSTRFFVSDLHNFSPSGIEYVSILLTGYSYSIKFPRLHYISFFCIISPLKLPIRISVIIAIRKAFRYNELPLAIERSPTFPDDR